MSSNKIVCKRSKIHYKLPLKNLEISFKCLYFSQSLHCIFCYFALSGVFSSISGKNCRILKWLKLFQTRSLTYVRDFLYFLHRKREKIQWTLFCTLNLLKINLAVLSVRLSCVRDWFPVSSLGLGALPSWAGGGGSGRGSSSPWRWRRGGFIRVQVCQIRSDLLPGHHHTHLRSPASQAAAAVPRGRGRSAGEFSPADHQLFSPADLTPNRNLASQKV